MNKLIPERNFLYLPAKSDHQKNQTPQEKLFEQNNSRHCTPEARMRDLSARSHSFHFSLKFWF
jgi:hypothetical protein